MFLVAGFSHRCLRKCGVLMNVKTAYLSKAFIQKKSRFWPHSVEARLVFFFNLKYQFPLFDQYFKTILLTTHSSWYVFLRLCNFSHKNIRQNANLRTECANDPDHVQRRTTSQKYRQRLQILILCLLFQLVRQ